MVRYGVSTKHRNMGWQGPLQAALSSLRSRVMSGWLSKSSNVAVLDAEAPIVRYSPSEGVFPHQKGKRALPVLGAGELASRNQPRKWRTGVYGGP